MATKLYLTAKSPTTVLNGPLQGTWSGGDSHRDARQQNRYTCLLDPDPTFGGRVNAAGTAFGASTTKAANQHLICAGQVIWVTKVLAGGGTLAGTVTITMKVRDGGAASGGTAYYHLYAYITVGDTLTPRAVAVSNVTDATAWTSLGQWQSMTCAIAGSYLAGDRIVFEIGASVTPPTTPPGDNVVYMSWGTTGAGPTWTTQADAVHGSSAGIAAAWLQLSADLSFVAASAPPANDACADAIAIPALPYTSPVIDTTGSLDPEKAVWFTWTAPSSTRVFITTRGSNYHTSLWIYEGCGGTNPGLSGSPDKPMWTGRAQASAYLTPEAGRTYAIKVLSASNGPFGAVYANGSLSLQMFAYSAPAIDDLFINCQYIVSFRGQTPVNWQGAFYGNTPTAAAIDYTRRPMVNLDDGSTHTGERYVLCLFGAGGLLEVLDLATLSVGVGEIDYLMDIWDGNDNPGSLVFDASGNLIVGWYGDHYDVNGSPATAGTASMRVADATHADNQPGAPFAQAQTLAAAIEAGGTDFVDLASDQDTIFYTSGGTQIKRWSRASGQLADWGTVPASLGPRPGAHGLRVLPPSGTGADGLLVTVGDRVYRLNGAGTVIQSYVPTPSALAQDLDKVEITHDGTHFWVSDQLSATLFQFNLASGAQVDRLDTGLPTGQLSGFTIYQGYRAGNPPPETPVEPPVEPPGPPGTTPSYGGGGTPTMCLAGPPQAACWAPHDLAALQISLIAEDQQP